MEWFSQSDGWIGRVSTLAVVIGWLVGFTSGFPPSLFAQAASDTLRLSLADARGLALRTNPELLAARLDTAIARGELRQAGLFLRFNPSVDLLAGGVGTEFGIAQEIEIAGQQSARRAAAQAGLERATAGVHDLTRLTIGDVDRTFYRLVSATQRAALATEVLDVNRHLAEGAGRRLKAGEISPLDLNLATVELGRSRARALAASREQEAALVDLRQLLGLPFTVTVVPVVDAASDATAGAPGPAGVGARSFDLNIDSLTAIALTRRPDLAFRRAAEQEAAQRTATSRREVFPNLLVLASSEVLEGTGQRVLRPGVGIALPIFDRNQGTIQALRAATEQAGLAREALVARIRTEVRRAAVSYEAAAAQADVLEMTVLAPARENRRLLEIAYREGKIGLPVLLLVRNYVIDAELEYWDAWLAAREARADLGEVTGENTPNPNPGTTQ